MFVIIVLFVVLHKSNSDVNIARLLFNVVYESWSDLRLK